MAATMHITQPPELLRISAAVTREFKPTKPVNEEQSLLYRKALELCFKEASTAVNKPVLEANEQVTWALPTNSISKTSHSAMAVQAAQAVIRKGNGDSPDLLLHCSAFPDPEFTYSTALCLHKVHGTPESQAFAVGARPGTSVIDALKSAAALLSDSDQKSAVVTAVDKFPQPVCGASGKVRHADWSGALYLNKGTGPGLSLSAIVTLPRSLLTTGSWKDRTKKFIDDIWNVLTEINVSTSPGTRCLVLSSFLFKQINGLPPLVDAGYVMSFSCNNAMSLYSEVEIINMVSQLLSQRSPAGSEKTYIVLIAGADERIGALCLTQMPRE